MIPSVHEPRPITNWSEQVVLVAGGSGSFGKKFIEIMLREYRPHRLIVLSRDELKQRDMRTGGNAFPRDTVLPYAIPAFLTQTPVGPG